MIDWGASIIALLPVLLVGTIVLYLGFRAVRALEMRRRPAAGDGDLAERVRLLEDALESLHTDIERLTDAQHFTSRLLDGRAGGVETPSSVERGDSPPTPPRRGHP